MGFVSVLAELGRVVIEKLAELLQFNCAVHATLTALMIRPSPKCDAKTGVMKDDLAREHGAFTRCLNSR
jgi:hypothetical protein